MDPTSVPPASVTPPWNVFPQQTLEPVDIAVLVLYFLFVLAVGLWVSRRCERLQLCPVRLENGAALALSCFPLAAFHWTQQVEGGVYRSFSPQPGRCPQCPWGGLSRPRF